jgi:Uma2 family endonuclease
MTARWNRLHSDDDDTARPGKAESCFVVVRLSEAGEAGTLGETAATLLSREDGRAEVVRGRVVQLPMFGHLPGQIIVRISRTLADHAEQVGRGDVFTSTMAFIVIRLNSGRESFSPCVSWHDGPPPSNPMSFINGAPTFAVEVRSENDYGTSAERDMAAKRADYFEAGTQVVWDVDPVAKVIRSYRAASPSQPIEFGPGSQADAEPALPGWSVSVDWIMS